MEPLQKKSAEALFSYFLHDSFISRCRRMLTVEQFRSPGLSSLYTKLYEQAPLSYQSALFQQLILAGQIRPENPDDLALSFYAPILFLLQVCDRQPDREPEALQKLASHVHAFHTHYSLQREESL